jgi:hypothetical protein
MHIMMPEHQCQSPKSPVLARKDKCVIISPTPPELAALLRTHLPRPLGVDARPSVRSCGRRPLSKISPSLPEPLKRASHVGIRGTLLTFPAPARRTHHPDFSLGQPCHAGPIVSDHHRRGMSLRGQDAQLPAAELPAAHQPMIYASADVLLQQLHSILQDSWGGCEQEDGQQDGHDPENDEQHIEVRCVRARARVILESDGA